MDSIKGKPKRLESVVGFFLLAILIIITITLLITQSDYDMTRFGVGTDVSAPGTEQLSLSSLIPAGFDTLSNETYLADNLYEKINGKAPLYIESGFVKLSTARFVSKDDESLWMELFIFDMANIKNAFCVYSVQKRPGVDILPDMQFGYRTTDAPYFVHGKYYVEFIASSKSDELFKAMMETVQKIQAYLPIDVDIEIPELSFFPQENLVAGSFKLYLESAFGFEGFTDIYTAQYKFDDETITAFFSRKDTAAEATKSFESYHKFLIENGGEDAPSNNPKVKFVDFYGTLEIVTVAGPFVFGVHEAENPKLASKVEKMILNKLREMGNIPKK